MIDELYTLKDVALLLQVTYRTVQNYVKDGKIKASKIGKEYRVKESDIKDFLESNVNK